MSAPTTTGTDRKAPIPKLSQSKLCWVAGVFDLKARVINKNNKQRSKQSVQMVLYVESKNYTVIRTLCRLTGTSVETQEAQDHPDWMRKGCAEHCPDQHVHVNNTNGYSFGMPAISRWTATGAAAAIILYNVIPHMETERGLGDALEEMLEQTVTSGQGWGAVKASIRRLRDLGWTLPPEYRRLDLD